MKDTMVHFDEIIARCKDIFLKKNKDYGASWRVLRPASLTDQILIKACRIRSIDEKQIQKVDDPIEDEFLGLINYSIMALIQLSEGADIEQVDTDISTLESLYNLQSEAVRTLLAKKNHDYGEAWRKMRLSGIIDIILMKVHRIMRIEQNQGKTLISEGVAANYHDIINYAVFALIKLEDQKS